MWWVIILAMWCVLAVTAQARSDNAPSPDFKPLLVEVRRLAESYYPGIYGELELRPGNYRGQVLVPQVFDKRYFTLLLVAPYAVMLDHHLYVHLKDPRDVSPEFLENLQRLVNQCGKLVLAHSAHRPPNERLQRTRPASSSPAHAY